MTLSLVLEPGFDVIFIQTTASTAQTLTSPYPTLTVSSATKEDVLIATTMAGQSSLKLTLCTSMTGTTSDVMLIWASGNRLRREKRISVSSYLASNAFEPVGRLPCKNFTIDCSMQMPWSWLPCSSANSYDRIGIISIYLGQNLTYGTL